MDKAYITGNDPKLLQEMVDREGLWLCCDSEHPEAMVLIVSLDNSLWALKKTNMTELSLSGFKKTAQFYGPFRPEDVLNNKEKSDG